MIVRTDKEWMRVDILTMMERRLAKSKKNIDDYKENLNK